VVKQIVSIISKIWKVLIDPTSLYVQLWKRDAARETHDCHQEAEKAIFSLLYDDDLCGTLSMVSSFPCTVMPHFLASSWLKTRICLWLAIRSLPQLLGTVVMMTILLSALFIRTKETDAWEAEITASWELNSIHEKQRWEVVGRERKDPKPSQPIHRPWQSATYRHSVLFQNQAGSE
jgi:hypothetical protein